MIHVSGITKKIVQRLYERYQLTLLDYVASIDKVGHNPGEGFDFFPTDTAKLEAALLRTGAFYKDDKKHLCDAIASAATKGQGYREVGVWPSKSLHFQISKGQRKCNVHLDKNAFRAIGPGGIAYFNPDFVLHTGDDLVWKSIIVGKAYEASPLLGKALYRFSPIMPHSSNGYQLKLGGKLNVYKDKYFSVDLKYTRKMKDLAKMNGPGNPRDWSWGGFTSALGNIPGELKDHTTVNATWRF